jgi:hypothetical protein
MAQRRELSTAEAGDSRAAGTDRPGALRSAIRRPGSWRAHPCRSFRRRADAPLRHLRPQAARNGVLGIERQRLVERGRGLVELPQFHAATGETRPRSLVRGRQSRDFFVDPQRVSAEVAALRVVDRRQFEGCQVAHDSS